MEIKSFGVLKDKELEGVLTEVNRFLKGLDKRTTRYLHTRLRPMSADKLFCYVEVERAEEGEYFLQPGEQPGVPEVPLEKPKPKVPIK